MNYFNRHQFMIITKNANVLITSFIFSLLNHSLIRSSTEFWFRGKHSNNNNRNLSMRRRTHQKMELITNDRFKTYVLCPIEIKMKIKIEKKRRRRQKNEYVMLKFVANRITLTSFRLSYSSCTNTRSYRASVRSLYFF